MQHDLANLPFARRIPRIPLAAAVLLPLILASASVAQMRVCDLKITACPENYRGTTLNVPNNVVALSSEIASCTPTIVIENGGASKPPAIMFVVDQSGSMTGNNGNDVAGARYTIMSAFLDSLYKITPAAEVGVAIFKTTLWFDPTTGQYYTAYFKRLPSVVSVNGTPYPDQAYLQLIKLDQQYNTSAGTKLGINIIKDVVALTNTGGGADLAYTPNFESPSVNGTGFSGETNYNIAFDAARAAFTATTIPKERQFVIFLTDGEPNQPWSIETSSNVNYFQQGINVPTTFSVFFTDNGNAPQSLVTMTNAIRASTYSTTNDSSNYWAMTANHTTLLNLLVKNVLSIVSSQQKGTPLTMTLNGVKSAFVTDSSFVFGGDFPLAVGTNSINLQTSYSFKDITTGVVRDSVVSYIFTVNRSATATTTVLPTGAILSCRDTTYFTVSVAPVIPNASENGALGRFTFTRNNSFGNGVVYYTIMGTATNGTDYTRMLDSVVIQSGQTSANVDVLPLADASVETDETVIVTIQATRAGRTVTYTTGSPASATVTISDYANFISVARVVRDVTEGDFGYFVVTRTDTSKDITVYLLVSGTATSGTDFTAIPNFVFLAAGKDSVTVRVQTTRDFVPDNAETVILGIGNDQSTLATRYRIGSPASDTIVIADFANVVTVSAPNQRIEEGDSATFVVSRVDAGSNLTVYLKLEGTATANADYPTPSASVFLPAGATQGVITIVSIRDYVTEGDETVVATIIDDQSASGGAYGIGTPSQATITITDFTAPVDIVARVVNNPFRIGEAPLPGFVNSFTFPGKVPPTGQVIVSEPDKSSPLLGEATITGVISIYDVVKNPIVEQMEMGHSADGKRLAYVWDGYTQNGRRVAPGTYLTVVTTTIHTPGAADITKTRKSRIGVKR